MERATTFWRTWGKHWLIVCVLVLCTALVGSWLERRAHRDTVSQLVSKVNSLSLDAQARCAEQARTEFKEQGFSRNGSAGFENHYNSKLNKCFIEIDSNYAGTGQGGVLISRTLTDAFEHRVYGTYGFQMQDGKKYSEVAPFECKVVDQNGQDKQCHSDKEYEVLIRPFLTN